MILSHYASATVFTLATSIGWKYWRKKKPDSQIHKIVTVFLNATAGLALTTGVVFGMFLFIYSREGLTGVLMVTVGIIGALGVLMLLYWGMQRLDSFSRKHDL